MVFIPLKNPPDIQNRDCINDYFGRFLADELGFNMTTGPWLAGGSVRKSFLGYSIENSDWDVWFSSHSQFDRAQARMDKIGAEVIHRSENSFTFRYTGHSVYDVSQTVQLIKKKYYSSPREIIDNFDFTVCQLVTDGRSIMFGDRTIYDLNHRLLNSATDYLAENIMSRMIKYMVYGYRPTAELLDMIREKIDTINFRKYTHEYDSI